MTPKTSDVAVISGDLVGSTRMEPKVVEAALGVIRQLCRDEANWIGSNFTRQSGDGWQIYLGQPRYALRSALLIRAALRSMGAGLDSYFSIAAGRLAGAPPDDLNETNDPLFIRSGRQLAALKADAAKTGIRIGWTGDGRSAAAAVLADHISQDWTAAQAQAISLCLPPDAAKLTYSEAADQLGISRQAATKALKAAGLMPLRAALTALETA